MLELKNKNEKIPQLVSVIPLKSEGKLPLKKAVRQHLGLNGKRTLYLDIKKEIILSAQKSKGWQIKIDSRNLIHLPDQVLSILKIKGKEQIGLIERADAVAIKTFQITEEQGNCARFFDIETNDKITRKVQTNPALERFVPMLVNRYKKAKLKFNILHYLKGRKSLEAWLSRRLLGKTEKSDKQLMSLLIEERLKRQQKDGSWSNEPYKDTATLTVVRSLMSLGDYLPSNFLLCK